MNGKYSSERVADSLSVSCATDIRLKIVHHVHIPWRYLNLQILTTRELKGPLKDPSSCESESLQRSLGCMCLSITMVGFCVYKVSCDVLSLVMIDPHARIPLVKQ